MYADKTSAGCSVAGTCLAITGMDLTQVIFWTISAAVLIIAGLTVYRWSQASPKSIDEGTD